MPRMLPRSSPIWSPRLRQSPLTAVRAALECVTSDSVMHSIYRVSSPKVDRIGAPSSCRYKLAKRGTRAHTHTPVSLSCSKFFKQPHGKVCIITGHIRKVVFACGVKLVTLETRCFTSDFFFICKGLHGFAISRPFIFYSLENVCENTTYTVISKRCYKSYASF